MHLKQTYNTAPFIALPFPLGSSLIDKIQPQQSVRQQHTNFVRRQHIVQEDRLRQPDSLSI